MPCSAARATLVSMDPLLEESVAPVLRDLARDGITPPRLDSVDWTGDADWASSMMWGADGSGTGMSVQRSASLAERVAAAADQLQEWAIEGQLWAVGRTNWPPCPRHPDTHPLEATVVAGRATWVCRAEGLAVALVGGGAVGGGDA